jgi:hypothetical protein
MSHDELSALYAELGHVRLHLAIVLQQLGAVGGVAAVAAAGGGGGVSTLRSQSWTSLGS